MWHTVFRLDNNVVVINAVEDPWILSLELRRDCKPQKLWLLWEKQSFNVLWWRVIDAAWDFYLLLRDNKHLRNFLLRAKAEIQKALKENAKLVLVTLV